MSRVNPYNVVEVQVEIRLMEKKIAAQQAALTNIHHVMRDGAQKVLDQILIGHKISEIEETLNHMINIADEWDRHHAPEASE
jgi:hypothetical protein